MMAMVALGTWAIVVLWGVTEGFNKTMIEAQIRLDTGDLQVHRREHHENPSLRWALDERSLAAVRKRISRHREVRATSARLVLNGLLKSVYGSTGVEIRGVELPNEAQVTEIERAVVQGGFLEGPHEIVLGRTLAHDLDVRVGERVVLEAQGIDRPQSRAFRLVGIVSTGLPLLDRATAFVPLEDAQALVKHTGATAVVISLRPGASPPSIAARLEQELDGAYAASTLLDLNPLLANLIKIGTFEMMPTMLVLSILAGFGVANTVMFTVLERTQEFGVLTALGLKPRLLARLVFLESTLASLFGFALGGAAGYAVNAYLARFGVDLGTYAETFPDLGMPHVIYASTSGWYWLYGLSVVVLTAILAAWYPARRAAQLEPSEAMRYA